MATMVPSPTFFVLGAYVQDIGQMAAWQARGVNTMVQAPEGADIKAWSAYAAGLGLSMIRQPLYDPNASAEKQLAALTADAATPQLLAWAQPDEPSNTPTVSRTSPLRQRS